jgi:hypothetical protein
MSKTYLVQVDGEQPDKLTLKQIISLIHEARHSKLTDDGRLDIITAKGKCLHVYIPTVKTETTFPVQGGYAVGKEILHEKSYSAANYYLCKDGKIRELAPPSSCA